MTTNTNTNTNTKAKDKEAGGSYSFAAFASLGGRPVRAAVKALSGAKVVRAAGSSTFIGA